MLIHHVHIVHVESHISHMCMKMAASPEESFSFTGSRAFFKMFQSLIKHALPLIVLSYITFCGKHAQGIVLAHQGLFLKYFYRSSENFFRTDKITLYLECNAYETQRYPYVFLPFLSLCYMQHLPCAIKKLPPVICLQEMVSHMHKAMYVYVME